LTTTPRSATANGEQPSLAQQASAISSLSIDADAEDEDDSELDDEVDALLASSSPISPTSPTAQINELLASSTANGTSTGSAPRGFGTPSLNVTSSGADNGQSVNSTSNVNNGGSLDMVGSVLTGAWGAMGVLSASAMALAENISASANSAVTSGAALMSSATTPSGQTAISATTLNAASATSTEAGALGSELSPLSFFSDPLDNSSLPGSGLTSALQSPLPTELEAGALEVPAPPVLKDRSASITIESMGLETGPDAANFDDMNVEMLSSASFNSSSAVMEAMEEVDEVSCFTFN
jgi:hypothetical protein